MNFLKKKKILLIVTGGIASYKSLDLIRRLQDNDVTIECILTKNAEKFVNILSFESLLGKKTHSNLFSLDEENNMSHIKLANSCDAILVAPCTANFLSKMVSGSADDLATNVLLASDKVKIIAPAMNTVMWSNKIVKKNIKDLKKLGVYIFSPQSGKLACGTKGSGKLMEVNEIINELNIIFSPKILDGIKVIVTAGPSIEKIDPVRFISNFSSGLQGYEIAKSLANHGAKTLLISGPTNLEADKNIELIDVESGEEFLSKSIENLPCDVFISVAAISDWRVKKIQKKKIKKHDKKNVEFTLNDDVLKKISFHKKRPKLVVGFSAETENLLKNTKNKLHYKGCDWILANQVIKNNAFSSDMNKIYFFDQKKIYEWPKLKKNMVALKLTKKIVSFFKNNKLLNNEKNLL
ncbi:MAG: bifunctional phosphopantothenoylcysteine decarboxylase/phosphopantothenate--cysteine ligase CoaBC [Pseudomonadota bacterium]|nr:bifunctional phosphopantothenoylcysteine decarboxylase/phosphopantothenate--cysteine ligase CoaBC [Pseudomonadota bacterium]